MPELSFRPLWWDGTGYSEDGDGALWIGDTVDEDVQDVGGFITHVTSIQGHSLNLLGTASLFANGDVIAAPPVEGEATLAATAQVTAIGSVLRDAKATLAATASVQATATVELIGSRLVNTSPGEDPAAIEPGKPIHMGFKSVVGEVQMGTVRVDVGLSGLVHENVLPESNPNLLERGLEVTLETSEHRRPLAGQATRAMVGNAFTISKLVNDLGELSVYEMKVRIKKGASLLARVRVRKAAWSTFNPDWMDVGGMTGVYIGLEHGGFNTSANVFLRDNAGAGELILGGPLQAFDATRPGQVAEPFSWNALANGTPIDIYIYFNLVGRFPPFVPPLTPIVEVWTKVPNDTAPVVRHILPVGSLGTFPDPDSSVFPNFRHGPDEIATLHLGNIGQAGDVLTIDDWEFYPEYRPAVIQGEPLPDHEFRSLPDSPVSFRSAEGKLPTKLNVGRWFKAEGGLAPNEISHFQPGRRSTPLYTTIKKPLSAAPMVVQKKEPRLEVRTSGMMIEALVSGAGVDKNGQSLDMGIGVDDGTKSYRAVLLDDATTKTVGIVKDEGLNNSFSGYHIPTSGSEPLSVDYRSLKFIRLLVDRARAKVCLYVEDESQPVMELNLADVFPSASISDGRFYFGHLGGAFASGDFNVAFLNYLSQYFAWEGRDGFKPDNASQPLLARFTEVIQGNGSTTYDAVDDAVLISKDDFTVLGSKRFYNKTQDFTHEGGVLVDFRTKVLSYNNNGGQQNAPKTDVGVGLRLYFGNKVMHLGFYDCGVHGQKIAILPKSGTVDDILTQTELGRKFSANANFFDWNTYRVSYKAFDKIEVWSDTIRNRPIISIPWTSDVDGFDLPLDPTPAAIAFGHFEQHSSSQSKWQFIRWGRSTGYETAVTQKYADGFPKYLFGGRAIVVTEFED